MLRRSEATLTLLGFRRVRNVWVSVVRNDGRRGGRVVCQEHAVLELLEVGAGAGAGWLCGHCRDVVSPGRTEYKGCDGIVIELGKIVERRPGHVKNTWQKSDPIWSHLEIMLCRRRVSNLSRM